MKYCICLIVVASPRYRPPDADTNVSTFLGSMYDFYGSLYGSAIAAISAIAVMSALSAIFAVSAMSAIAAVL